MLVAVMDQSEGELDVLLLEDGAALVVLNDGVAQLPCDLVEGRDAGAGEVAREERPGGAGGGAGSGGGRGRRLRFASVWLLAMGSGSGSGSWEVHLLHHLMGASGSAETSAAMGPDCFSAVVRMRVLQCCLVSPLPWCFYSIDTESVVLNAGTARTGRCCRGPCGPCGSQCGRKGSASASVPAGSPAARLRERLRG